MAPDSRIRFYDIAFSGVHNDDEDQPLRLSVDVDGIRKDGMPLVLAAVGKWEGELNIPPTGSRVQFRIQCIHKTFSFSVSAIRLLSKARRGYAFLRLSGINGEGTLLAKYSVLSPHVSISIVRAHLGRQEHRLRDTIRGILDAAELEGELRDMYESLLETLNQLDIDSDAGDLAMRRMAVVLQDLQDLLPSSKSPAEVHVLLTDCVMYFQQYLPYPRFEQYMEKDSFEMLYGRINELERRVNDLTTQLDPRAGNALLEKAAEGVLGTDNHAGDEVQSESTSSEWDSGSEQDRPKFRFRRIKCDEAEEAGRNKGYTLLSPYGSYLIDTRPYEGLACLTFYQEAEIILRGDQASIADLARCLTLLNAVSDSYPGPVRSNFRVRLLYDQAVIHTLLYQRSHPEPDSISHVRRALEFVNQAIEDALPKWRHQPATMLGTLQTALKTLLYDHDHNDDESKRKLGPEWIEEMYSGSQWVEQGFVGTDEGKDDETQFPSPTSEQIESGTLLTPTSSPPPPSHTSTPSPYVPSQLTINLPATTSIEQLMEIAVQIFYDRRHARLLQSFLLARGIVGSDEEKGANLLQELLTQALGSGTSSESTIQNEAEYAALLLMLSKAVLHAYDTTGEGIDLAESIAREALSLISSLEEPCEELYIFIDNLAIILSTQLEESSDLAKLNETISLYTLSIDYWRTPSRIRGYASLLIERAQYPETTFESAAADVNSTVLLLREAILGLQDPGRTYKVRIQLCEALDHLGITLFARWRRFQSPNREPHPWKDVKEAIGLHRRAIKYAGTSRPNGRRATIRTHRLLMHAHNNLGIALGVYAYEQARERYYFPPSAMIGPDPFYQAIHSHLVALGMANRDGCSTRTERMGFWIRYHITARRMFQIDPSREDMAGIIGSLRRIVRDLDEYATAEGRNSDEVKREIELVKYELGRDLLAFGGEMEEVKDEAIALLRATAGSGHMGRYRCNAFADALLNRYTSLWQQQDVHDAIQALAIAVEDRWRNPRLTSTKVIAWLEYFHAHSFIRESLSPELRAWFLHYCEEATALYRSLVSLNQSVLPRLQALKRTANISRLAATHALALDDSITALRILELGRNVFWHKALLLRTESSDETRELERFSPFTPKLALESYLRDDLESVGRHAMISSMKAVDISERFVTEAAKFLKRGPVVILVEGSNHLYALVVQPGAERPENISFPSVPKSLLQQWRASMDDARHLDADRGGKFNRHKSVKPPSYEDTLADIWRLIVKPIILHLGFPKRSLQDSQRRRIWWCPTGQFTFVPLHAAGVFTGPHRECLAEYAVSSYTSSVANLVRSERPQPSGTSAEKVLVLTDDLDLEDYNADRAPRFLNNVSKELDIIQDCVLSPNKVVHPKKPLGALGRDLAAYLEQFRDCAVVHFACHGTQNAGNPLHSHFTVFGGLHLPVVELMRVRFEKPFFAFLAACESAVRDETQADEAIHLASSLEFLGFRSIIGTLWSMSDIDGPRVARHIYGALFRKDGALNTDGDAIAFALDAAVHELRNMGSSPVRWATYIHIGI